MKRELEIAIQTDYPAYFRELYGFPAETCMAFGVQCDDGWEPIIRSLCEQLTPLTNDSFRFSQIKEKFGTLRIYWGGDFEVDERVLELIEAAEELSRYTCETCGLHDEAIVECNDGHWLKTLCPTCRKPD